jgi:hypothetical protein
MVFSHSHYEASRGHSKVNFPLAEGVPQTAYTIHAEIIIELSKKRK